MSSMSSRLRSTLGEDAKPMKKDNAQILLQKYVAGLLTMKVACPKNVSEIEDLKAYKLFGLAYIEAGGTISDIQKLYVENGGTIDHNDMVAAAPVQEPEVEDEIEDDVMSEVEDDTEDEVIDDNPFTPGVPEPDKKFDFNTATREKISNVEPTVKGTPKPRAEITDTQRYINTYLKRNREILTAQAGNKLIYNEELGTFTVATSTEEEMPTCAGKGYSNVDKKTRFFIVNDTEFPLGNAGNNGVYDDFYFKRATSSEGRLVVVPGSNYYQDEETKGKFYTQILSDNGMNAAMHVEDSVNLVDITDDNAVNVLKASAYLPTLPELVKIIDMLPAGIYWTSSVAKDGTANIALSVQPDQILANVTKAKLVTFIKFD